MDVTVLIFVLCLAVKLSSPSEKNAKILSRPKRFVVFPGGSEISVACSMYFKTLAFGDIFRGAMQLQVAYDLPNETIRESPNYLIEPDPIQHRRHRRDVYKKLEVVIDWIGFDGRECMLRALCEATQRLLPGKSLGTELLKTIFTFPLESMRKDEPSEHHQYDAAHRKGLSDLDCAQEFGKCPVSFLDLIIG